MNVRTVEDGFEYQMISIFEDMQEDYKAEQRDRKEYGDDVQTFSEWLWANRLDFGEMVYNRFDEYAGIDESTEHLNY